MTARGMTSLERVLTAIGRKEPDRVPFFLLATMHGAKELGLSIKDYFSRGEHVAEGQLRLRAKYGHDCLYAFFYAPVEIEAFGGEVIYTEDGPPNSGRPFLSRAGEIGKLRAPDIAGQPCLQKVLKAIRLMKKAVGDEAPIIGVAMSPFSLPVMQMGFERYLDLLCFHPVLFRRLMRVNEDFCAAWANAQVAAGATAICYFDPVSSTTVTTRDQYLKTGFRAAKRTIPRINAPTATHFASGKCLPIVGDAARTGTAIIGVSATEDLAELKAACGVGLTVLGNLNGIAMRRWTPEEAEENVKDAVRRAGPGGGFILSDNHGEIPFQVPDDTLLAVSEAVRKWGRYPLTWASHGG